MATTCVERDLKDLLHHLGVDLADLPPIMNTAQVATLIGSTPDAVAQNRYTHPETAIPWVKCGRLVRYLRVDVVNYLIANRHGGSSTTNEAATGRPPKKVR